MKKIIKWVVVGVLGLITLLAVAVAIGMSISDSRLAKKYDVTPAALTIPTGFKAYGEGERLYKARGCIDCHGDDGVGAVVVEPGPFGTINGSNLSLLRDYSEVDWARAIRHGINKEGKAFVLMPSYEYYEMSDRDLSYLIAYLRVMKKKGEPMEKSSLGPIGKMLHVTGAMPMVSAEMIDHDAPRPKDVEPGETVEYGAYLAVGCKGCHGETYSGGPMPGAPKDKVGVPTNITKHESGLAAWSKEDFFTLMREGKRPDGSKVNGKWMPYEALGQMTDMELTALWMYLQSIPAKKYGGR